MIWPLYDLDLLGIHQMHPIHEDPAKIIMENNNKYHKQLQQETPRKPTDWFPHTEEEKKKQEEDQHKVKVFDRGMHRWKALPEPIDVSYNFVWFISLIKFILCGLHISETAGWIFFVWSSMELSGLIVVHFHDHWAFAPNGLGHGPNTWATWWADAEL